MDETLESVCGALDELGNSISSGEQRCLVEFHGWHNPSINFEELSNIPRYLAKEIRKAEIHEISDELKELLQDVPRKLQLTQQHTVPQILNSSNAHQAIPAYMATIEWISIQIRPLLLWQSMQDSTALPPMLAHRISTMKRLLDEISLDKDNLNSQIRLIQDATEAAQSLPTDIISLKDARKTIADLLLKSEIDNKKVSELTAASVNHEKTIKRLAKS